MPRPRWARTPQVRDTGGAERADWRLSAACRKVDPEVFFPTSVLGADAPRQERIAKDVCACCPVVEDCLRYALDTDDQHAVMGGTTPRERHAMKDTAETRRQAQLHDERTAALLDELAAAGFTREVVA